MNTFEVCLKIPRTTPEPLFSFSFNNITYEHIIANHNADSKITIKIHGNVPISELEQHFLQEYQVLFFNYGYFPEIISSFKPSLPYYESGKTNHASFFRVCVPIYTDLKRLLNINTLEKYAELYNQKMIKIEPIVSGFFSLFSQDYLKTLIEHKTILLLHIIEGYAKYITKTQDSQPAFEVAVKYILKECFHDRSNGKQELKIRIDDNTKNDIKSSIEPVIHTFFGKEYHDTLIKIRNYYSHLGYPCKYEKGSTLWFLFLLISMCFRVRITNDITFNKNFSPTENNNIKEYFLTIVDYTKTHILQEKCDPESVHFAHEKMYKLLRDAYNA